VASKIPPQNLDFRDLYQRKAIRTRNDFRGSGLPARGRRRVEVRKHLAEMLGGWRYNRDEVRLP